jgi:UDP-glucose 4-epimerase
MAKIMITGVAGLLGSHLARRMLDLGHDVYGIDNLVGGYFDNIPRDLEFIQADTGDYDKMVRLTKGIDIVYHAACIATEGFSVFSPNLVTKNTYQNTISVASASIKNNVKRFVYCSSMARYGTQDIVPFTEDMLPRPQDPYGIAKYAAELTIQNLSETHGMEYNIAVPHNIIGPGQKYNDPYRNVAGIMINRMLQDKPVYIYGDGSQKRCFSFVQDAVNCLEKMGLDGNIKGEIINIGPDDNFISINDLYETLSDLMNIDRDPIFTSGRPKEVHLANCSADKARRLLGYNDQTPLTVGLQSMIDFISKRGTLDFDYSFNIEIENTQLPKTWKEKLF